MSALGLVFLPLFKAMGVSCSVTQPETVPHALIVLDPLLPEEPYTNPKLETGKSSIVTLYQSSNFLNIPIVSLKLNLQKCCPKTTLPSLQLLFITTFINQLDFQKKIYGFLFNNFILLLILFLLFINNKR